jgi:predicted permease
MPDWSSEIRLRLENLRIDAAREADVVEELSQHLDERYDELKAAGTSDADAYRLALAELLEPDVLTERMRSLQQAKSPPPLPAVHAKGSYWPQLWLDLKYAVRALRKQPRVAFAIVLTLALGIGANSAIFSLVNATLLTPLPVPERERLAYVSIAVSNSTSYPRYEALRDGNRTFAGLAAWGGIAVSFDAGDSPELVAGYIVTGNFFDVMRIDAARGRLLSTADDMTIGAHPVVVISHELWRSRFGGRDDIIGRDVRLGGHVFTIVGVAPANFPGPRVGTVGHLYVPMMMQPFVRPPSAGYAGEQDPDLLRNPRGWLSMVGRLKDSVPPEQASAELAALLAGPARDTQPVAPTGPVNVVRIDDESTPQRQQVSSVAWLLGGTVVAVLLIACANVANLLLTKAASRRLEFAVRLAMGASRARIVRQLLAESALLSICGGALGVALAWALAAMFRAAPPPAGALPIDVAFAIDSRVLLFTLVLSMLTAVLFGLAPALRSARPSLVPALKDSRFDADERGRRIDVKKPLVVAQVAISLLLLIAAGLFVRGLEAARAIELGFDADRLVTAPLNVNLLRYTTTQGREFYREIVDRVEALPGVESATLARVAVMGGGGRTVGWRVQGRDEPSADQAGRGGAPPFALDRNLINANVVGPSFFATLGIPLLAGRDFGERDSAEAPNVAVINEAAANLHFPGGDALGARVSFRGPAAAGPWYEIVGVVGNSKYADLGENELPVAYMPLAQNHETGMTLYVRSTARPESLLGSIRREIETLEPALPVVDTRIMEDTIGAALYSVRMSARLLAGFGALALLLAAVGLYGVLSFQVASRTHEIGIRLALGARARDVFNIVVRDGLALVAIGVVVGLLGALAAGRALAGFLYGVSPADTATYVAVTAILCAVAGVACAIPARRAMRMDPIAALRYP